MEYIGDAVGVSDIAAVRRLGFKPSSLARLISETFNEMIFTHGHVHCDPHAANMLVRKDKVGVVLAGRGVRERRVERQKRGRRRRRSSTHVSVCARVSRTVACSWSCSTTAFTSGWTTRSGSSTPASGDR
jgi:predicted unusual protein kinase regulating ubiquinone biosynthesis (AarF/ABC1/UbiB family)